MEIPLEKYVWELTVGEKQRVEMVKALARNSEILLMDEPTALLSPREVKALLSVVRRLADKGKAVVFVTRKIREAVEVSDRITVLRRGRRIGVYERLFDEEVLLEAMFQGVVHRRASRDSSIGCVIYRTENLYGERVKRVNIELRRGELVVVLGVAGNGQEELMALLSGFSRPKSGKVFIDGEDVTGKPFLEFLRRGVAYLPEDRSRALAKELSVLDNFKSPKPDTAWFCVHHGGIRRGVAGGQRRGGEADREAGYIRHRGLRRRRGGRDSCVSMFSDPGLD